MREILFRGKRVDGGEWCYGVPLVEGWSKKTYIASYEYSSLTFIQQIEIIPKTVGQFTGLTDKNGKRIFEGDVVCEELYRENKGVVKFGEGTFDSGAYPYIGFFYEDILGYTDHNSLYFSAYNPFIVLGNIHDNPELLTD